MEPKRKRRLSSEKLQKKSTTSKTKTANNQVSKHQNKSTPQKDFIEKSKQWSSKLQVKMKRSSRTQCLKRDQTKDSNSKVCEKRKPMPSLAELEELFEDSEDDNEPASSTKIFHPERPTTPEQIVNETCEPCQHVVPVKRLKKSGILPNSMFNANSDKIATHLKEIEHQEVLSDDSTSTISYDCNPNSLSNKRTQSFSPIPSTSKDNETYIKNNQLLQESLLKDTSNDKPHSNRVSVQKSDSVLDELLLSVEDEDDKTVLKHTLSNRVSEEETQIEIILQGFPSNNKRENNSVSVQSLLNDKTQDDSIEIIEPSYETIDFEFTSFDKKLDVSVQIVDDENDTHTANNCDIVDLAPTDNNTLYSTINSISIHDSDCEIIDVDSVLADNQTLIKKYQQKHIDLDTVTSVVPNKNANNFRSRRGCTNVENARFNNLTYNSNEHTITVQSYDNSNLINNHNIPMTSANLHLTSNNRLALSKSAMSVHSNSTLSATSVSVATSNNETPYGDDSVIIVENVDMHPANRNSFTNNIKSPQKQVRSIGDCPICMDNLSIKEVASTVCGHLFCMQCIKAAIKNNGKKCPNCRKSLVRAGGGYHQIFL